MLDLDQALTPGMVGTMFGFPVKVDNGASNASANTVSGPVFGSMEHAMFRREVRDVRIMRLVESFADFLTVGYLGYHRVDSRSNDLRAAIGVKYNAT